MQFYHDRQRDLLIYERPSPLFLAHVPHTSINGSYVAVKHTLQNAQTLRWLGYPVAPVLTDQNYDWPIGPGKSPGEHQKLTTNFMLIHPKCFVLSDPGTQKTMSALWAADALMQQYPPGKCRCLIVGPLNVIETVWVDEIWSNLLGRRTFEILYGDEQKRLKALAKKPDFAIVNIDGVGVGAQTYADDKHIRKSFCLAGFSKALFEDTDIKIILIDEADGYVDSTTKRHRIARAVYADRPYLWMLTGTPTSQRPDEAYGLAKMVNNALGKSYTSFRDETMFQVGPHIWRPKKDGYEKAFAILTPAIRFTLEEIWKDRPSLTTALHQVSLTSDQQNAALSLKRTLQIQLQNGKKLTAANEAVARGKLLQIILGAVYDEHHKVHVLDAEPRYQQVEQIITSAKHKVLIFCPLTSVVDLLYKRLSRRWKCGVINGHVAPGARMSIIKAYRDEANFKVMIVDAQSVSHGINQFTVADTVIWMAPIDKTRLYIQGNRRVWRPGQKNPVTVHQITATPLEQEMYRRLETNTSMQGALLSWIRKGGIN
jgi:SNF2 family DNA or RNA helicase